jgi:transcriptional regulator with XRE-family HTH domain
MRLRTVSTLSDAIKAEFERILGERKLSRGEAARKLGVTRQAFYNYMIGKSIPRQKTLARAIELWKFKLDVNGLIVDSASLPPKAEETEPAQQLLLFEGLDAIKQRDLKVAVQREGPTFRIEVKIDLPAA